MAAGDRVRTRTIELHLWPIDLRGTLAEIEAELAHLADRLVDDDRSLIRRHNRDHRITCVTEFGGHRHELDGPGHWTRLFFLDEAIALAAGHRPCERCRRAVYNSYRDALAAVGVLDRDVDVGELNRRLGREPLRRGQGRERAGDRIPHTVEAELLCDGIVIVIDDVAHLVIGEQIRPFGFDGWAPARPRLTGIVEVLTPPLSHAALTHGFTPELHPSATTG